MDEYEPLIEDVRGSPVRYGYAYIKFQLSNQTLQIKRIFPGVLSVAENVGGVAEMLVFAFVFMML